MRRVLVLGFLVVLVSAVAGCGRHLPLDPVSSGAAPDGRLSDRELSSLRSANLGSPGHAEGTIGPGTQYSIDVPSEWNGDLILYAHGYTNPADSIHLPDIAQLKALLLGQGFAVAYSSFSENGYALKDGVQRTEQLRGIFVSKFGRPRRVFLIGSSLGGIIVLDLAETHPEHYAGALTVCGVLGGTRAELDYIGTLRVLFDAIFPPGLLPGTLYDVPPIADFNAQIAGPVVGAIQADPSRAGLLVALMGGRLPFANGNELVASILNGLGFQLQGANDLFDRTHSHSFFENTDVVYTGPVPPPVLDHINATVARYSATPDAVNYLEHYYEPDGHLAIPFLAMATTRDPVVPIFHESIYQQRVAAAGASALLLQRLTDRYGHVNFTPAEIAANFRDLVVWVDTGVKPNP
ncbi:MAG: hypothetical protein E6K78_00095 [Candidatus Eisenbacteria bacterium]|uniref:Alpha/beta hydrolase n=1 Tax=Eiseniibacteriota bacterium TaxID=2212470 RepID=A0A538TYV1_UNCEI|nr:MAG: hypothetical protein E6K78_00095 [Candidatus Eisenbacteria bacterium]